MRKIPSWAERATGGLSAIALLLLLSAPAGHEASAQTARRRERMTSQGKAAQAKAGGPKAKEVEQLRVSDVTLRLDELKALQGRPLPGISRNPFEYEVAKAKPSPTAPPGPPPAPPGPPPVPLQSTGFVEVPGGGLKAFISDGEELYVVHEGEKFAKRFQVMKITASFVEVLDESTQQKVQLPYVQ